MSVLAVPLIWADYRKRTEKTYDQQLHPLAHCILCHDSKKANDEYIEFSDFTRNDMPGMKASKI